MQQTLRTQKTQEAYEKSMAEARKKGYCRCYLCAGEVVKEFNYWRIVENEYPYDKVADIHHMLALRRHAREDALTADERREYKKVREHLHLHYDILFENTVRTKSIPGHHHFHMITLKQDSVHEKMVPQRSNESLAQST